jgi:hypothetical protein
VVEIVVETFDTVVPRPAVDAVHQTVGSVDTIVAGAAPDDVYTVQGILEYLGIDDIRAVSADVSVPPPIAFQDVPAVSAVHLVIYGWTLDTEGKRKAGAG